MGAKKLRRWNRDDSAPPPLPHDITQEIDPTVVEDLLQSGEATWTQTDFDEITVVLPEHRQPKP